MICRRQLLIVLLGLAMAGCSAATPNSRIKKAPYTVFGVRYFPYTIEQARQVDEVGMASWYGPDRRWFFFGGGSETTANGEKVTSRSLSAAHKLLPLPSRVEVTNLENGRRATLRVNDRGPFVGDRLLDVSSRAAEVLGFKDQGLAKVRIRTVHVGD